MSKQQAEYKIEHKNKSHLLINEQALQVLPSLAIALGLEEAIAIQQLHYWLNNPKNEGRVDEDGNKWVYNTYAQWKEDNFPFWSEDKIQRVFLSLQEQEVVIAKQLDAKKRDMKKFYRIDYDKLCAMDDAILRPSNTANLHDVKMNQRLPENTSSDDFSNLEKQPQPKPDLVDGYLAMANFPGAKNVARVDAILSYIGGRLQINTETKAWKEFAKKVDNAQRTEGQKIDVFFDWLLAQPKFELSYWPPSKMWEHWPRAFTAPAAPLREEGQSGGYYG